MFAYEDTHWWFRGKRAVVASMLERFSPAHPGRRAVDIGCGTGANLALLGRYGEAHGIDVSPLALELCRRRGLRNLACASAARLPRVGGLPVRPLGGGGRPDPRLGHLGKRGLCAPPDARGVRRRARGRAPGTRPGEGRRDPRPPCGPRRDVDEVARRATNFL